MMAKLTVLNVMAGKNFEQALDLQRMWGISVLDLKNNIYGKSVTDLNEEDALLAAKQIASRDMSVYCFSTELFHDDIELGADVFKTRHLQKLEAVIATAEILKPTVIRLIAARSCKRNDFRDSVSYVNKQHPWLIPMYREAVNTLYGAGYQVTIENEHSDCLFSEPAEIVSFFQELDCAGKVSFTYDVQNLWQMGTFPTMDTYRELAPWIGYFHVKGGRTEGGGTGLAWKSSLEDASWPVAEMTQQVVNDGVSPVICLNPCHGALKNDYNYEDLAWRDLQYLRRVVRGLS
jgi:sugar phosphate isomerase/epimerase